MVHFDDLKDGVFLDRSKSFEERSRTWRRIAAKYARLATPAWRESHQLSIERVVTLDLGDRTSRQIHYTVIPYRRSFSSLLEAKAYAALVGLGQEGR